MKSTGSAQDVCEHQWSYCQLAPERCDRPRRITWEAADRKFPRL